MILMHIFLLSVFAMGTMARPYLPAPLHESVEDEEMVTFVIYLLFHVNHWIVNFYSKFHFLFNSWMGIKGFMANCGIYLTQVTLRRRKKQPSWQWIMIMTHSDPAFSATLRNSLWDLSKTPWSPSPVFTRSDCGLILLSNSWFFQSSTICHCFGLSSLMSCHWSYRKINKIFLKCLFAVIWLISSSFFTSPFWIYPYVISK